MSLVKNNDGTIDPAVLREIGEWSALGFYEAVNEPWPRAYGRAFLRLYQNMEIIVPEDRLLIPCEPMPRCRTMASHGVWSATSLILNFNHHCGWHVARDVADEKKQRFPQHAAVIEALVQDLEPRLPHFGGYTHSNPDTRRVVQEGFAAMERELDAQIAAVRHENGSAAFGELPLLLALKDYAVGVRAFHARTVAALRSAVARADGRRQRDLTVIADSFASCFFQPARAFIEGLLAVNFTWMLDGCDSIGRFDQVLGALFEQDAHDRTLDLDLARRLLEYA